MSDSAKSSPAHSFKGDLFDEVPTNPDLTVIDGWLKFRDQKKWKLRWGVVTKLSPAADCLHLQLYRDSKDRYKQGMTKASLSLEHFLGVESGFTTDKESNTIAIICRDVTVILAFDSRERLIQWQTKISYNLGESTQFLVQISNTPSKTKLQSGPAKLHIQNHSFCLTSGVPPKLVGYWETKHLRRYGVVDGKFCFEGGSLCGKGEGLYIFLTDECEEISWNMQMASEGRLIPKRRFVARNMSVMESPSRRYIQGPSDSNVSTFSDTNTLNSQNGSYRSFGNVYEWPSMELPHVSDFEEKSSAADYNFCSSFPEKKSLWTELDFQKFANSLNLHSISVDEKINNVKKCDPTFESSSTDCYTDMSQTKSTILEKRSQGDNQPPERPPKPAKYKPSEEFENSVITKISCANTAEDVCEDQVKKLGCEQFAENAKRMAYNQLDNYDVPNMFCSKVDSKVRDGMCPCRQSNENLKTNESREMENYDIPPIAVPVSSNCSCVEKKRLIIESEKCYNMNVCPCQHLISCWPYNWLQLAYCRRGNTIQDTATQLHLVNRTTFSLKSEVNASSLYAKVDLSKKTKRKPKDDSDGPTQNTSSPEIAPQLQAICDSHSASYANLLFENSLKFYENARELVRNGTGDDSTDKNCAPGHYCVKCGHSKSVPPVDSAPSAPSAPGDQENYILMNPICSEAESVAGSEQPSAFCSNLQLCKSMDKFAAPNRRRSDSTGSAKSVPPTFHHQKLQHDLWMRGNEPRVDDKSVCKSESADSRSFGKATNGNRDSSSSNDSGFSFGSLKLQAVENGDAEQTAAVSSNPFVRIGSPKTIRSKSSDPMKDITFQFHGGQSADDIPVCHKKISSKDSSGSRSETGSSIPFIDSQSTSSETSDISDYIETLSLSSHSSSDTSSNAKLLHPAASVLRPRSGKEYEKVTRVMLHCGNEKQETCVENSMH